MQPSMFLTFVHCIVICCCLQYVLIGIFITSIKLHKNKPLHLLG